MHEEGTHEGPKGGNLVKLAYCCTLKSVTCLMDSSIAVTASLSQLQMHFGISFCSEAWICPHLLQ